MLTALVLAAAAGAQSEEDYELGAEPEVYVRPTYPEGVVTNGSCGAFFEVEADGDVEMRSLSVTCTDPVFIPAVRDAMAQWRFEPTIVDGRAVVMTGYSARITFTDGTCARVASGNFVDRPCAPARP
jgi:hypothetical protein